MKRNHKKVLHPNRGMRRYTIIHSTPYVNVYLSAIEIPFGVDVREHIKHNMLMVQDVHYIFEGWCDRVSL